MTEHILRKVYFNEYSKNDQDIFMLLKYEIILQSIVMFIGYIIFMIPIISLIISMYFTNNFIFSVSVLIYQLIYTIIFLDITCYKYKNKIKDSSKQFSSKLYFYLLTMKGRAITRKDFKIIKCIDEYLYNKIYTQNCTGFCYYTCFEILKILKKGTIQYYRIRAFEYEQLGKKYTMHAVYVNNGFIFDVYSSRQYSLKQFYKKFEADLMYGEFYYEDVANKSYEEFMDNNDFKLRNWCNENDCYLYKHI